MGVDLSKGDLPDEAETRWVTTTVDAMPRPGRGSDEPWKLSIGGLLARHPRAPRGAGRVLGLLDRFGAIEFGPKKVGFDGDDVPWSKVIEIRTRTVDDIVLGPVSASAIDQVRDFLPPIPGRKWAVRQAVQTVTALVLAAREDLIEERDDRVPIPCEIVYLGRLGGVKRIEAGLFAALCMDRRPEAGAALLDLAARHRVAVCPAEPHRLAGGTAQRAQVLRRRTRAAAARIRAAAENRLPG
ncbi:hypothetical protein DPM19_26765 [Actinomadura craniellae]|uniref:Uncharacterized protein n=1 Tax=Actinomadura craniellae TaxID=2231787 RepID=A0A365GYP6_9ACTN|nr:hypothetical protein [Actinomadura craniellae]RAY11960.1 hypothetical protein DPM19_26765 [Actinomadura craniellae]